MRLLRKVLCHFGQHKQLDVIQTFGAAQHVGCPDCGKRFAIHHGMRAFLPWSADFADLYRTIGHEVDEPLARWQAYRRVRNSGALAPTQE